MYTHSMRNMKRHTGLILQLLRPCLLRDRTSVCLTFVQDTRQQLQATQKALEAELQGLVSQASSLESRLAAEPAKQRALALQV